MSKKISVFIKKHITSQEEEVAKILSRLGFDFKLSGTLFLLDAIVYGRTYKSTYCFETLVKDLYDYVAQNNNTTINRVKWSVERSINYMYNRHTKESYTYVENCFNIKYPEIVTPKLLINVLVNNLG